ncbi:MAG: hypothetical protein NVSMB2_20330 [Chloroflexota bacterium]
MPYVAMVASTRRAAAVSDRAARPGYQRRGSDTTQRPAGLDIGAATGPEIALSVMAEIMQRRRSQAREPVAVEQPRLAINPICGMQVDRTSALRSVERDAEAVYFCAPGCRKAFLAARV